MSVHKRQYASMKISRDHNRYYDKFCLIESESNKIAFRSNFRTDAWIIRTNVYNIIEYNRSYLYIETIFLC